MKTNETRSCVSTRNGEGLPSKLVFLLLAPPVLIFLSVWRAYRFLSDVVYWSQNKKANGHKSEMATRARDENKRPLLNAERGRYFDTDGLDGMTPNMPRRNRVVQRKRERRKSLSL